MAIEYIALGDTGAQLVSKWANSMDAIKSGSGGIGYIIQPTDAINTDAWWTTAILTNQTFSIVDDFDFSGATVNMPSGVVLIFNGGVWSNGMIVGQNTIFTSYGEQQCFEISLTLSGTWKVDYITPQNYGAITNANTVIFANDCTAILQKCVDSIFNVYCPSGFYYLVSSVYITKTKIIKNIGRCDYADAVCSTTGHTRFYTDQDIDIFVLRATNIQILDGVIDIMQATTFSHSCIYLDANYFIGAPHLSIYCYGSKAKLKSGAQTGNGIYCNLDITTIPSGGSYGANIGGAFHYLRKGINIPALGDPLMLSFCSIYSITSSFWGNKQDMVLHAGELNHITCLCQADYVCIAGDFPIYAIDIECTMSVFDLMIVDYGKGFIGSYATPDHLINNGVNNAFIGNSRQYESHFIHLRQPVSSNGYIANPNITINNILSRQSDDFISLRDNAFSCPQQNIAGTEVAIYDGTGYDFDTKLDSSSTEGLGAPLSLVITNGTLADMLFPRGEAPFIMFNTNNAGLLTDFLEIVLPLTGTLSTYLYDFGICITSARYFRRIQFIFKHLDGYYYNYSFYPDDAMGKYTIFRPYSTGSYYYHNLAHGRITNIVVRLIGLNDISGAFTTIIEELFGKSWRNNDKPIIDIAGGQTIYGTLGLTGAVIQTELTGALTDGAPTDAEIDSITGTTPAAAGAGWKCTIKDTTGTGLIYLVESDGTNWFYTTMTKAV